MDHGLVERLDGGREAPGLPQGCSAQGGDFRPLRSSIPPQTPVAWSNFIAGTDPGGHGIFDFFRRDPSTSHPAHILDFSATETTAAKHTLRIGNTILPLSGGTVRNLRGGRAFWQVLEEHGIPSTVIRMPSNYPPVATRQRTLSGMNTPDLKGTYGIFNYYTNEAKRIKEEHGGGGRVHDVYVIGNRVEAKLPGPANSFRAGNPETEIDFKVFIDPVNPAAKIVLQGQEFILKEKEWSGWKRVRFSLLPTQSVGGICQFYLKEVRPKFKLYVSPDPHRPGRPRPAYLYARFLLPGTSTGASARSSPRACPADTAALDNDVLDEEEFLAQDDVVLQESRTSSSSSWGGSTRGFFSITSRARTSASTCSGGSSTRSTQPTMPSSPKSTAGRSKTSIARWTEILDRVLRKVDKDTLLLVMSDHGFNPFRRGFNLNTWLCENGYHRLTKPWKQEETLFFDNTDWAKTRPTGWASTASISTRRAVNSKGIVAPGPEKENLVREIARKLEALTDPKTGERAILQAYVATDVYHGPYVDKAPDIVLGFNRSYRISWQVPPRRACPRMSSRTTRRNGAATT